MWWCFLWVLFYLQTLQPFLAYFTGCWAKSIIYSTLSMLLVWKLLKKWYLHTAKGTSCLSSLSSSPYIQCCCSKCQGEGPYHIQSIWSARFVHRCSEFSTSSWNGWLSAGSGLARSRASLQVARGSPTPPTPLMTTLVCSSCSKIQLLAEIELLLGEQPVYHDGATTVHSCIFFTSKTINAHTLLCLEC